jgi:zinc transport system substrate-binding protein
VVASIFPIGDLARTLAGGAADVMVLLPPRASPSTFEPTARQMAAVANASAFLFVGGGMDRWAEAMVRDDAPIVRLTTGMSLVDDGHTHEGDRGTGNPHVWLDPLRVRDDLLPRIEAVLIVVAPDSAPAIQARARSLAGSLTALDVEIRTLLADVPRRGFVSTHSAWVYFAERYGLEEIGSVYESPGREPSARYLAGLVDDARGRGTRAVFIEPQLGEAGARTVASELDVRVYLLDPYGGEGQEDRNSYLMLMRYNAQQMARALGDD